VSARTELVQTLKTQMLPRRRPIWKRAALWTLQGWLAMFYVAAGFAKLTEPQSNLDLLIPWSAFTNRSLVSVAGWLEIIWSAGMLSPLFSSKIFGPVMRVSAMAIFVWAVCFALIHAYLSQVGLVAVNVILAGLSGAVILMSRD